MPRAAAISSRDPCSSSGTKGQFDLVISGLPLNNFSSEDVQDILQAYAKLLKPGGILSFFQYILIRPAKMFVSVGPERDRLKGVGRGDRRRAGRARIRARVGLGECAAGVGASHTVLRTNK